MARRELPVLTCDRCGHTVTIDVPHKQHAWGLLSARPENGKAVIPSADASPVDLCPTCLDGLHKWWLAGKTHDKAQT